MPDNPLDKRLVEWLETQGYPLEMYVAKRFEAHGFTCLQSDYYLDRESQQYREIDVQGITSRKHGNAIFAGTLACECKASKGKPWVLFTNQNHTLDTSMLLRHWPASEGAADILWRARVELEQLALPLLRIPLSPGYGVTQSFTTGQDVTYSACLAVLKAAKHRASLITELSNKHRESLLEIIFPVISIDCPLYEAYLDDQENMIVSPIDRGVLIWRNPIAGALSMIHVVTRSSIDDFASDARRTCDAIMDLLERNKPD